MVVWDWISKDGFVKMTNIISDIHLQYTIALMSCAVTVTDDYEQFVTFVFSFDRPEYDDLIMHGKYAKGIIGGSVGWL